MAREQELRELLRLDEEAAAGALSLEAEALQKEPTRSAKTAVKVLSGVLLAAGVILLMWRPELPAAALDFIKDFAKNGTAAHGPCLCLFDIDRTLTSRQDAGDQCPGAQAITTESGKVTLDYAYGGGQLHLSEVAQNLDKTFCSQWQCHMGIISAGGGSGPDEQGVLYGKLKAASSGQAGDASWSHYGKDPVGSQKIVFTPDPEKGAAANQLHQWLNSPEGGNLNIPADEVYFFDDRWGNAPEMAKFGFNGREVACGQRDDKIGNGIVGLCGALLREIVPDKGIKTCKELLDQGFYK
mmetsp:Transcript_42125/g.98250  ORF Transcript_42125/g.98250 Transcript_42125/m.98250 type:complete len:297 (-) Transcript_42125:102-992(-)